MSAETQRTLQVELDGVPRGPGAFFSFERAKTYWVELSTRESLEGAAARCTDSPYAVWIEEFRRQQDAAIRALNRMPSGTAETIRGCYDLQMTYNVWKKVYQARGYELPAEWNATDEGGRYCQLAAQHNLFANRSCNGIPDWRTVEARTNDEARLLSYRSRKQAAQQR